MTPKLGYGALCCPPTQPSVSNWPSTPTVISSNTCSSFGSSSTSFPALSTTSLSTSFPGLSSTPSPAVSPFPAWAPGPAPSPTSPAAPAHGPMRDPSPMAGHPTLCNCPPAPSPAVPAAPALGPMQDQSPMGGHPSVCSCRCSSVRDPSPARGSAYPLMLSGQFFGKPQQYSHPQQRPPDELGPGIPRGTTISAPPFLCPWSARGMPPPVKQAPVVQMRARSFSPGILSQSPRIGPSIREPRQGMTSHFGRPSSVSPRTLARSLSCSLTARSIDPCALLSPHLRELPQDMTPQANVSPRTQARSLSCSQDGSVSPRIVAVPAGPHVPELHQDMKPQERLLSGSVSPRTLSQHTRVAGPNVGDGSVSPRTMSPPVSRSVSLSQRARQAIPVAVSPCTPPINNVRPLYQDTTSQARSVSSSGDRLATVCNSLVQSLRHVPPHLLGRRTPTGLLIPDGDVSTRIPLIPDWRVTSDNEVLGVVSDRIPDWRITPGDEPVGPGLPWLPGENAADITFEDVSDKTQIPANSPLRKFTRFDAESGQSHIVSRDVSLRTTSSTCVAESSAQLADAGHDKNGGQHGVMEVSNRSTNDNHLKGGIDDDDLQKTTWLNANASEEFQESMKDPLSALAFKLTSLEQENCKLRNHLKQLQEKQKQSYDSSFCEHLLERMGKYMAGSRNSPVSSPTRGNDATSLSMELSSPSSPSNPPISDFVGQVGTPKSRDSNQSRPQLRRSPLPPPPVFACTRFRSSPDLIPTPRSV